MVWIGKLIGGAIGFYFGGVLGLLLGIFLGHKFIDKPTQDGMADILTSPDSIQARFFSTTFSVMGHMAKADGQVSEDEIAMTRQIMEHMKLDAEQKKAAIDLFNQGKQPGFDLDGALLQFKQAVNRRTTLLQMFMEIQLHAAYADGKMHADERNIINRIAEHLGFSAQQLEQLSALVRSNMGVGSHRYQYGGSEARKSHADLLKEAYEMLGVAATATDPEVKKAYRRMMNQHHPDKLVSKGLPKEMIEMATEKTQQIRAAYELIIESRKS
jgi:DnaJ like chaperone protein